MVSIDGKLLFQEGFSLALAFFNQGGALTKEQVETWSTLLTAVQKDAAAATLAKLQQGDKHDRRKTGRGRTK